MIDPIRSQSVTLTASNFNQQFLLIVSPDCLLSCFAGCQKNCESFLQFRFTEIINYDETRTDKNTSMKDVFIVSSSFFISVINGKCRSIIDIFSSGKLIRKRKKIILRPGCINVSLILNEILNSISF